MTLKKKYLYRLSITEHVVGRPDGTKARCLKKVWPDRVLQGTGSDELVETYLAGILESFPGFCPIVRKYPYRYQYRIVPGPESAWEWVEVTIGVEPIQVVTRPGGRPSKPL